ncbi:MAG: 2Fe-2S iron-sulfur cluster-binding protein [Pyrinomonadaceae bacterium]
MSVEITFEPQGLTGLVAEGAYVWEAAKRMGVRMPAECAGRGECDTCAVTVTRGAEFLSPVTDAEKQHLNDARRGAGERLACQSRIVQTGEVVLHVAPEVEKVEENHAKFRKAFSKLDLTPKMTFILELEKAIVMRQPVAISGDEVEAEFRREFNEMSLERKLAALVELEGSAAVHGVINVANLPFTVGEKVMDLLAIRGRKLAQADFDQRAPGETSPAEPVDAPGKS